MDLKHAASRNKINYYVAFICQPSRLADTVVNKWTVGKLKQ